MIHVRTEAFVCCPSNLWFMRVGNFASQFFSAAILLQQRVELHAKCAAGLHGCKHQTVPSNLAAASALDTLRTAPENTNKTSSLLGEANTFTKANISLSGTPDYAGLLSGGSSGLLCPSICFECKAGTNEGGLLVPYTVCSADLLAGCVGVPLVNEVCHQHCAYVQVKGKCTDPKQLPRKIPHPVFCPLSMCVSCFVHSKHRYQTSVVFVLGKNVISCIRNALATVPGPQLWKRNCLRDFWCRLHRVPRLVLCLYHRLAFRNASGRMHTISLQGY